MSKQSTPKRDNSLIDDSQFTPVKLHESPATQVKQRNITGYPRVVRDIAADIYNDIQKWNDLHIRGAQLIKEIASIKSTNNSNSTLILEDLCNQVLEVVELMQIIVDSLKSYQKKLSALINLHKSVSPMFISWPVSKFSETAIKIANAYEMELKLKRTVCGAIGHSRDKDEAMFNATCWATQPYIDSEVNVALESLLTETGHRSIQ